MLDRHLPGIYNVAGDGLLPWSEVAQLCGKRTMPMPPVGTGLATWPLNRIGVPLPPELLDLLRYGRGVDNRRLKEAGFRYEYTSAGAVKAFIESVRLRQTVGSTAARLPLRARRRAVLPALAGRGPRRWLTSPGPTSRWSTAWRS